MQVWQRTRNLDLPELWASVLTEARLRIIHTALKIFNPGPISDLT